MTAENFAYWLQGYFELVGESPYGSLTAEQVGCIKRHLNMVFHHDIDPKAGGPEVQKKLNELHGVPSHQELLKQAQKAGGQIMRC